jgi:methionyl-tRNA formyltransferase
MPTSLIVLTSPRAENYWLINDLAARFNVKAVVLEQNSLARARRIIHRIVRQGFTRVLDQLVFKVIDTVFFQKQANDRFPEIIAQKELTEKRLRADVRILKVSSINSDSVTDIVKTVKPDVIVVAGTSILTPERIHSFDSIPVINIHTGMLPWYRGQSGGFWAVVNDDWGRIGTTVHVLDEGIDTGAIISQKSISLATKTNPRTLSLALFKVGIELAAGAIQTLASNGMTLSIAQNCDGRCFQVPTFTAYLTYRSNMEKRLKQLRAEP